MSAVPLDLSDPRQEEISRRLEAHYRLAFGEGGERLKATGLDLAGKLLYQAYLHRAFMTRCSFEEASLREGDLSSTEIRDCSFRGADLHGASFVDALVYSCDFREANLGDSNLIGCGTSRCDFRRSNFGGARMLGFGGHDCDFREADLSGVTFEGATFRGSLVVAMNLTGASGTLLRPNHVINVGTPATPRLLRDEDVLHWFRSAGAGVEWFAPAGAGPPDPLVDDSGVG